MGALVAVAELVEEKVVAAVLGAARATYVLDFLVLLTGAASVLRPVS